MVVHGAGPQIIRRDDAARDPRGVRRRAALTTPGSTRGRARVDRRGQRGALRGDRPARRPALRGRDRARAEQVHALGLVGDPLPSRPDAIDALADGKIPVVAPLAAGPLNVNADEAAAALAVGLGADKIVFVTDVAGPAHRRRGGRDRRRGRGGPARRGDLQGGIVPKLEAAVTAARAVSRAEIAHTGCTHERRADGHRSCRPTRAAGDVRRGRRAWLVDDNGERYLDFSAGIAVLDLGHRHPASSQPRTRSSTGSGTRRTSTGRSRWWSSRARLSDRFGPARRRSSATPAPRRSRRPSSTRARRPARQGSSRSTAPSTGGRPVPSRSRASRRSGSRSHRSSPG